MAENIQCTVVRATNLIGNDGIGANKTSDPYVELTLLRSNEEVIQTEIKRTKVVPKNVNPIWNETFVFGADVDRRSVTYLCATIFDKNLLKNVPLGRVLVPIDTICPVLAQNTSIEQPYRVEKCGKMKAATGELFLKFASSHATEVARAEPVETKPPNVLLITVENAAELPAMDHHGTSDPFVSISCNKTRLRTTTKRKTVSCMWHESFKIPVTDKTAEVIFVVEDFDATINDFIGQAKVPLNQLDDGKRQTVTLALLDRKFRQSGHLGTLTVSLQWVYVAHSDKIAFNKKKAKHDLFAKAKHLLTGGPNVRVICIARRELKKGYSLLMVETIHVGIG
jgi:hypothetical protein